MARKVDDEKMSEIDEILKHEDPEFVKELENTVDSSELQVAELEAAFMAAELEQGRIRMWWNRLNHRQKQIFIAVVVLVTVGPASFGLWRWYQGAPVHFETLSSLESISDESMDFDVLAPEMNFMNHFMIEEFLFDIPDTVFHLRPKRGVRFGRFAFYLEMREKAALKGAEKKRDEIIEVFSVVLGKTDVDDFKGIDGKEKIRQKLMTELTEKVKLPIVNVRYRMIVFN